MKQTTQSLYMKQVQKEVFDFFDDGHKPSDKNAEKFSIHRATMYRWFKKWQSQTAAA